MFYKIMKAIVGTSLRLFYKIEFLDYEKTPKRGGYIVVANHISATDPIIITIKFKPQIHYMAKQELFKTAIGRWFFGAVGAFPVERGSKADMSALDKAEMVLKSGGCLGIFPEGKRSLDGEMGRGKSGAALLAAKTRADIIPIGITFECRGKFRSKITVRYGDIIKNQELGISDEPAPRELKAATQVMLERISLLREPSYIPQQGAKTND